MEISAHQLARAAQAATAEELLKLARAEGVSLTEAQAEALFVRLRPPTGELTDQELDAVSGGGCYQGSVTDTGFVHSSGSPNGNSGNPESERLYNPRGLGIGDGVRYSNPLMAVHGSHHCQHNEFVIIQINRVRNPDAVQGFVCKLACRSCQKSDIVAYLGQLDLL